MIDAHCDANWAGGKRYRKSTSGGTLAKCQNTKKADYWTDENSIGINLGSWLCMETWIFDTPYFNPCFDGDGKGNAGNCAGKISDGTTENYQRGELATIREYNQVANGNHTPGQADQTWTMFTKNIPPIGRVEPDALDSTADGAIKLMKMFWSTKT